MISLFCGSSIARPLLVNTGLEFYVTHVVTSSCSSEVAMTGAANEASANWRLTDWNILSFRKTARINGCKFHAPFIDNVNQSSV